MRDLMKEDVVRVVWFGDMEIIDKCFKRAGMKHGPSNTPGPVLRARNVLRALSRSPLFRKGWIRSCGWISSRETLHPAYTLVEDEGRD